MSRLGQMKRLQEWSRAYEIAEIYGMKEDTCIFDILHEWLRGLTLGEELGS
jgi:hypothetical protein